MGPSEGRQIQRQTGLYTHKGRGEVRLRYKMSEHAIHTYNTYNIYYI